MFVTTFSFGQTEKTLVQSFNLMGKSTLVLDLKGGDVEVQHWNNTTGRVQIKVELVEGSTSTLKSLATAGRYKLATNVTKDEIEISAPALEREISIRGKKLQEKISYIIFAPEDITVKMADETSTSIDNIDDSSSL